MTTEDIKFQWSDLITLTNNTYDTYLKLDKRDRDKYMKSEVKATIGAEVEDDLKNFIDEDVQKQIQDHLDVQSRLALCKTLFKQMKYHCGKPLNLTLLEKGPGKHLPIIEYFERNQEYLKDYDYILISQQQYITLQDENFIFFKPGNELGMLESTSIPFTKVGKIKNLDVYTTWMYPEKNIKMNEFDIIIGKRDWAEIDVINVFTGKNEIGYMTKNLLKMTFPVKRGFVRICAKY